MGLLMVDFSLMGALSIINTKLVLHDGWTWDSSSQRKNYNDYE